MKYALLITTAVTLSCLTANAEQVLSITNPGFEQKLADWDNQLDRGMSETTAEAAHEGSLGLRVTDSDPQAGSSLFSVPFKVTPGKIYQLRFWGRMLKGDGVGIYIAFYTADGKSLIARKEDEARYQLDPLSLPKQQKEWKEFLVRKTAPDTAVEGRIWIHSYISTQTIADFDEFHLVELSE